MNTTRKLTMMAGLCMALATGLQAQQKVSERTALGSGAFDPANDWFGVIDTSAGLSGSKKILGNNIFTGWGFTSAGETLAKAANVGAQRTALGLVIGTNVQAWDADLDSWSAKTVPSGAAVGTSDSQTLTNKTFTSPVVNVGSDATGDIYYRSSGGAFSRLAVGSNGQFLKLASGLPSWADLTGGGDLLSTNNLSDLASVSTARTNLGLGTAATSAASAFEAALGNPGTNGWVLSSTTAGVRSWVALGSGSGDLISTNNLSDLANVATARTNLGLAIGSNVQAWDADLNSWATKTAPSGAAVGTSDTQTLTNKTFTSPVVNVGSDATGDIYYRSSGGAFTRLGVGTNGDVLTLASGLPSWAAAGGGGLTNFTEAVTTSSPNATVPVVSFTATNAATNVDVAISPKGTGSIAAQVANGSTSGGDKRGSYSVDLQTYRTNTNQVASGSSSVIAGGQSNKATAANSVVAGGTGNTASGSQCSAVAGGQSGTASGRSAFVGAGYQATASGDYSAVASGNGSSAGGTSAFVGAGELCSASAQYAGVVAGLSCNASGARSFIGAGTTNTASGNSAAVPSGLSNVANGDYSWIPGGREATTRSLYGMGATSSGKFSVTGDAQRGTYLFRIATTSATQTELSLDGATPSTANRSILPNNSAYSFRGQAVARSSGGDSKAWRFEGTIERGANAAATAIIGTVATTSDSEAGASAWALTVDADTTNGSLRFQGTGAASTNIRWLVTVETAELGY